MYRRIARGLAAAVFVATIASPAVAQDEDLRMGDDPAYAQRVEVPEAGIAVSYPPDWDVSVEMEYGQTQPGDPYTGRWYVVRGSHGDDSCSVYWDLYPGASTAELVASDDGEWVTGLGGEFGKAELPIGAATYLVHPSITGDDYTTNYEIDADGMRWDLVCFSEERAADDWLEIAETLEWLPAEDRLVRALEPPSEGIIEWAPGSYELERVELPEAGIAMELPRDWEIDLTMEERELALPSGLSDEGAIFWVDLLYAEGASGDVCGLEIHRDPPLTVWEHAELLASTMLEDDPDGWHADVGITVVNGELGRQVDLLSERTMGVVRGHIWDSGSVRFVLTCGTDLVFNRSWLSMAESVELLEGGPAPAPQPTPESADVVDDIVDVVDSWESEPFDKFVYVSETEMMRASCDRAVWIEHTDGTWAERIDCQLTLEPVDPPAVQGEIPTKALTYQGGACEWPSDYWLTEDGSEIWAESWWMVIEPDGSVTGTAIFGDEALDCATEEELDEELPTGDDPLSTQRAEVPEAGIAMTIPAGWTNEIVMEPGEYQLPAEFADGSIVPYTVVSSAGSPDGGTCILSTYQDMPLGLEEHGLERGQTNTAWVLNEEPVITEVQRSAGPAVRLDFLSMLGWGQEYLFDMGGLRYVLSCFDMALGDETFWPIADSIEPLDTVPADEPQATDPSEASIDDRRVEFPDLGIGLTIPHFWTYELGTEETDYPLPDEFGEDARVPRTQFLSAFPFTEGVCWVSTYADMPLDPERHAREHGWAQYSSLSEADPETERVQLPAGEAYRVVYYSLIGGSVAYVFDVAGSRYMVDCVVGDDGGFASRSLAASITALGDEPPELGLQRLEFADADIGVTLPVEWEVQSVMDFIDTINVAGPETPESDLWAVMHAFPDDESWCDIYMLSDIPLSLEDHGYGFATAAELKDPPGEARMESLTLPIGDTVSVIETSADGTVLTYYLYDVGDHRQYLVCSTPQQPEDGWFSVAQSIESLSGASPAPEPQQDPTIQRIEVPEAGIALALPAHWEIVSETESMGPAFLPEGVSDADVEVWKSLMGYSVEDQQWCDVYVYDGIHLSLDDHAVWFGELAGILDGLTPEPPPAAIETGSLVLPIGDAATYTQTAEDGDVSISYLFDLAGNREYLVCGGPSLPDDAWLSVAETIVPLGVPDDAAGWSEVTDIVTVLPVSGPEHETYMTAECGQALWIEYADGSFEERLTCTLTDEPVDPPEDQGGLPQEHSTLSGGECEWVSDFWAKTDGREFWASSWSVKIEHDASATAQSWYAPEELDCAD